MLTGTRQFKRKEEGLPKEKSFPVSKKPRTTQGGYAIKKPENHLKGEKNRKKSLGGGLVI